MNFPLAMPSLYCKIQCIKDEDGFVKFADRVIVTPTPLSVPERKPGSRTSG